jgi:hypothetical protein
MMHWIRHRLEVNKTAVFSLLLILAAAVGHCIPAAWADAADASFLPTWKLLNTQEKQHFIAGYIHGWNDAARVTDVAIDFVKDNPGRAIETLQKVKNVIDVFYSDPDNAEAPLTRAVSSAREKVR